ncbi:NADH-quinone oxidoreductase subunit L [Cytophagaceae bacterium YF14B1]|uniref:NADH-quinone oxidoreductase subunit L n=1 Tax=Xanthocytophaga flava TaxID=3048013 RepID=A0AAE3U5P2_9BACT|nr:NADH-quinone oxidoreductase subunit L [Xanthocytophaga flavus]MDJ1480481.1 NADH-quinone oxidoreductase subunit L [Xanthocytophaga flavus]
MLIFAALFLPLIAFLCLLFLGKKLPRQGDWVAISAVIASFVCSVIAVSEVFPVKTLHYEVKWFSVFVHEFNVGVLLDKYSAIMLILVTFISALVQIYSTAYMKGDSRYSRYFAYLSLFTFAMLGLVLADNLFLFYFFWELVSVASYLLIGFWYEKPDAYRASRNAFIINRIGDTGLLLSMMFIYLQFGSSDFILLTQNAVFPENTWWMTLVGYGIFCAAGTKSAQYPMAIWLPRAMAGPTPVSALIHAATMVAAGVFLMIRTFPFLEDNILNLAAIVGGITAFTGAFAALFQQDIKRVLAYSTISQLGYMMAAIGVGAPEAALFHLVTHAFFKAGLFLCAGSIIDALHKAAHHMHITDPDFDVQDMRNMGGLRKQMPVTFLCFVICSLALAGLPLTSGFLSKDFILNQMLLWSFQGSVLDWTLVVPVMGFLGVLCTALYTGRQLKLIFGGQPRYFALYDDQLRYINEFTEESPAVMRRIIGILAILSFFFWFSWIPWDAMKGWFFEAYPIVSDEHTAGLWGEFTHAIAHEYTLILSLGLVTIGLSIALWRTGHPNRLIPGFVRKISYHFFYTEAIAHLILVRTTFLAKKITSWIDRSVIDRAIDLGGICTVTFAHILGWIDRTFIDGGVNLIAYMAGKTGILSKSIAGNRIQSMFTAALLGLLLILIWVVFI